MSLSFNRVLGKNYNRQPANIIEKNLCLNISAVVNMSCAILVSWVGDGLRATLDVSFNKKILN